jgi:hypothetical protein
LSPAIYIATIVTLKSSTGLVIGSFSVPAAEPNTGGNLDDFTLDFGPVGVALPIGDSLTISLSQVGLVGQLHVEGYSKLRTDVAVDLANT